MNKNGPGRIVRTDLAALPSGALAEAAVDASRNAWCRWYDGSWSAWSPVAAGVVDASIAGAVVDGEEAAYIVATPAVGRAPSRSIHVLRATGTTTATML